MRLGIWTLCPLSGRVSKTKPPIPELSDGDTGSCLSLKGKHTRRYEANILLPTRNLNVYHVGVVTDLHVDCQDPAIIVMSETEGCGGSPRRLRQCGPKSRHDPVQDSDRGRQTKACVFQCINHGLNDLNVNVTVQFNTVPWVTEKSLMKICEIEAYTF